MLIGIMLLTALHAFNELVLLVVMPAITEQFDSDQWYGLMMAAYVVSSVSAMVWTGKRIDFTGPLPIFYLALACLFSGHCLAIASWDVVSFVVARVLQGIGGGMGLTLAFALLKLSFSAAHRNKALSLVDFAWVIPSLIAPLLGGWLIEFAHWRWTFVIQFLPLISAFVLLKSRLYVKEVSIKSPFLPTLSEPLVMAVSMALVLYLIAAPPGYLSWLLLPASLGLAWAINQNLPAYWWRAVTPLNKAIWVTLISCLVFFSIQSYFPVYLMKAHGVSASYAGFILTLASLGWLTGTNVRARWLSAISQVGCMQVGFSFMLLGILLNGCVINGVFSVHYSVVSWLCCGFAMGILSHSSKTYALANIDNQSSGMTATAMSLTSNLAIAFAVSYGGALKNLYMQEENGMQEAMLFIWITAAILVLFTWLFVMCLKRTQSTYAPIKNKE
ncbi:MFS transporter [Gayadomonas joobiniege]|uniref:MFS transporter n=1 Tax=Gayadomonas joobiniege TaxID=1234606 RepID=UPI00037DD16C|nr:MFS transporter [Gayadomonas joobiniege]